MQFSLFLVIGRSTMSPNALEVWMVPDPDQLVLPGHFEHNLHRLITGGSEGGR
jgi:hypothetical protein